MLWYFVPKKRIYCLGKEDSGSVSFLAGSNEVDGWGAWARRAAGGMAHLVGWKRLDARGCHVSMPAGGASMGERGVIQWSWGREVDINARMCLLTSYRQHDVRPDLLSAVGDADGGERCQALWEHSRKYIYNNMYKIKTTSPL